VRPLTLSSGLSPVADPFARHLAHYLSGVLERSVVWTDERVREGWLRDRHSDLLWACGYLHASNLAAGPWRYGALAAPVMAPKRYQGQPVYFGDVIVRSKDPARAISELADRQFAFNETESFSGYQMLLRTQLIADDPERWLSGGIRTGSHGASVRAVMDGSADWAVIDSTTLDMQDHPGVRVIESIGPYASPPMLMSRAIDDSLRMQLTQALNRLHLDNAARALLDRWNVASFVEVDDSEYLNLLSVGESELTPQLPTPHHVGE
jgi:phosphonate transport system substrate-binding protein